MSSLLGTFVPLLYILGIGFALLAILFPIALHDKLNTNINAKVTIQEHMFKEWSEMPGSLGY